MEVDKVFMNIEVNSNGVNSLIEYNILPDERMREIGFTNYCENQWYFSRMIKFPKTERYRGFDISFNVSIPKDGSDLSIDVLDEKFLQPYDYQYMLGQNHHFEPALIVREQVEKWMEYLANAGVLSGHNYGQYI